MNSTTIQCLSEKSLIGICIFPVFYLLSLDNLFKTYTYLCTQGLKCMKKEEEKGWFQQMQK